MADSRQYLTEKLAEVQGRMQECVDQMQARYDGARRSHQVLSFENPPTTDLAQARREGAEAAQKITPEYLQGVLRYKDRVSKGVSYKEMWQVGNARRMVDPQWTSKRYTPRLLDMLEEHNQG